MEFISVLVYYLLILTSAEGLKISSKLSFEEDSGNVSDFVNLDYNQTGRGSKNTAEPDVKSRNFEAKIPFLLSKKKDGFEIKIPLTVEGEKTTESVNKITFLSGFDLFEKRSTEKTTEKTTLKTVPIVKGSLSHIKPDFLVPVPYERTTSTYQKESYTFGGLWPRKESQKNEIEGLKPPPPAENQWILNTTPFLSFPRNTTVRPLVAPTLNADKLGYPSVWNVLESGSWNPRDPLSWNPNRKSYWIVRRPGWNDFGHNYPKHHTRNVRYPHGTWNTYHQGSGGQSPTRGRWISCPPFEVNDIGPTARQVVPGCPQHPSVNPSDFDVINVTPVTTIDDKTSFKEFVGKPETSPEEQEPKVGE